MIIRIHNAITNEPLLVLRNTDVNLTFDSLSFSESLFEMDSCSFELIPSNSSSSLELLYGLEYVYVEDEDTNEIIWGGVLTQFDADEGEGASVQCLGLKTIFKFVQLTEEVTYDGNVLDSIKDLLERMNLKRPNPIILSNNSEVVENISVKFRAGNSIWESINYLVENANARLVFRYKKEGIDIIPEMLIRSSVGVFPQGVGINRDIYSNETEEKVLLKYSSEKPETNNILNFKLEYNLLQAVSTGVVISEVVNSQGTKIYESEDLSINPVFDYKLGKIYSTQVDSEVNSEEDSYRVAKNLCELPALGVTIKILALGFNLRVGDRISVYLKTKNATILSVAQSEILFDVPVSFRVDKISTSLQEGVKILTLYLTQGSKGSNRSDLITVLNSTEKLSRKMASKIIDL